MIVYHSLVTELLKFLDHKIHNESMKQIEKKIEKELIEIREDYNKKRSLRRRYNVEQIGRGSNIQGGNGLNRGRNGRGRGRNGHERGRSGHERGRNSRGR